MNFDNAMNVLSPKELEPYYHEINKLMRDKDYESLNDILVDAPVEKISTFLIVGLLRLTSSIKDNLPAWNALLSAAYQELDNRGIDANKTLRGL